MLLAEFILRIWHEFCGPHLGMSLHVACEQVAFGTRVVAVVAHELRLQSGVWRPLLRHFDDFLGRVHVDGPDLLAALERRVALFVEVVD